MSYRKLMLTALFSLCLAAPVAIEGRERVAEVSEEAAPCIDCWRPR